MLKEQKNLEDQINSIRSQLAACPEGKIYCSRNGTRYKWYRSDGKSSTYIPKAERPLAEQLAIKKYLTLRLKELTQEKHAIDLYLKHHVTEPKKSQQMLTDQSDYQKLLSPYFRPLSQELSHWANTPYEHNTKNPEHLIHKTASGHLVRSKSEALIDMALYTHKLPFRYECLLRLGNSVIYPDFTIRHPCTGNIYYWEHFGRMDDPSYSQNVCSKLQLYTSHDIIPSINLITTYETKQNPLSSEEIEKIIERYFS